MILISYFVFRQTYFTQTKSCCVQHITAIESFKVYLPSNACHNIYPNNKPSDYKTRLDQTIELDGKWEVGVESIFYSSKVEDENEKAQIHCNVQRYPTYNSKTAKTIFHTTPILRRVTKWDAYAADLQKECTSDFGILIFSRLSLNF